MMPKTLAVFLPLAWLSLAGCGLILTDVDAYGGAPKSPNETALLREETYSGAAIVYVSRDGLLFYDKTNDPIQTHIRLKLAPGEYRIYAKAEGYKSGTREVVADLDLKAGHNYIVKSLDCDLLLGCGWEETHRHHTLYLWIEDETIHKIVAGSPSEVPSHYPMANLP